MMTKDLFEGFSPVTKDEWINQAILDLKGKDFDQSLKSKLWDQLEVATFYTQEDLFDLSKLPENSFENAPEFSGFPARNWVNFVQVYPKTSNKEVLNALENGATGLILHLTGNENLHEILKEVQAAYISILIKPIAEPLEALKAFMAWIKDKGVDAGKLSGGLLWSPMDMIFERGKGMGEAISVLKNILDFCPEARNFRAFYFNFSRYVESGASGLDELVFGFGELVEVIAQLGIDPKIIFEKSGFFTSIGELHFPEIAKVKAMRLFASELAWQYGVELRYQDISIIAKTSHWSKSTLDVHTNLIRQTYEAMAAVLGGSNGIWVAPLQKENSSELELRIARNVSSILIHESYLDKVADPSAGSYYLDSLVTQIMEKTKAGIQNLEVKGGWNLTFELNEIQRKVRESRLSQQNQVLSGLVTRIGVNKFPAAHQLKQDLDFSPIEEKPKELKPNRASYLVELQNHTKP